MAVRLLKPVLRDYQSTYSPLPLEFLQNKSLLDQQKLDTTAGGLGQLTGLLNVEVDPRYDAPVLQQKQAEYSQQIDDAAKRLYNTGNINEAVRDIQNIKRSIAGDQFLQYAPKYWKQIQGDLEAYQKGLQTGKVSDYNRFFEDYYMSGNQWKGTTPDGKLQQYNPGTLYYEDQDFQQLAENMMNNIKPSGSDREYFNLGPNGEILSIKSGYEGIGDKRVRELASMKVPDFLNTTEGADFMRMLSYRYNQAGAKLDNNTLYQEAADYLYKAGANQIFSKTTSGQNVRFDEGLKRTQEEQSAKPTWFSTEIMDNDKFTQTATEYLKNLRFNDKGTLQGLFQKYPVGEHLFDANGDPIPQDSMIEGLTYEITKDKALKNTVNNWKNLVYGTNASNVTDEEFLTKVANSLPGYETLSTRTAALSNPISDVMTDYYFGEKGYGNYSDRTIASYDPKHPSKSGDTLDKFLGTLGFKNAKSKQDALKTAKITRIMPNDIQQGVPGSMVVNIKDSKGKNVQFTMESDDEFKNAFSISNKYSNALRNTSIDVFQRGMKNPDIIPGTDVRVYFNKFEDQNGNFIPTFDIVDNQGNALQENVPLEQLQDIEYQTIINSPYVRSGFVESKKESSDRP